MSICFHCPLRIGKIKNTMKLKTRLSIGTGLIGKYDIQQMRIFLISRSSKWNISLE